MNRVIPIRAYLFHLTHYDPRWYLRKKREQPINMDLAYEVIYHLNAADFNTLIIDCEDGLIYKSHPELTRRYSITQACLKKLLDFARQKNLEVIPKLNFSHSRYHRHNYWFRPYNWLFDNDKYFAVAFEIIDELIKIFKPKHFFHIGMDEDDERNYQQYINAICTLHKGLSKYNLRPIIWNDTARGGSRPWHARKSLAAEKKIPTDTVQVVWDYKHVRPTIVRRLTERGFEVWAAPSQYPLHVLGWKKAIARFNQKGLIMTQWIPCRLRNRYKMINLIESVGPLYSSKM